MFSRKKKRNTKKGRLNIGNLEDWKLLQHDPQAVQTKEVNN